MELFLNRTSPFARVARVCAIERGVGDRVTLRWVDPWSDDPALLDAAPLARVPALRIDGGHTITETLLIAQYLDRVGRTGPALFPDDIGPALEVAGLGQGLMEAAFLTVITRNHQGPERDGGVLGRRRQAAILRTLDRLDHLAATAAPRLDIGAIAVGVAIAYLEFRLPDIAVTPSRPSLARWGAALTARDSFRDTAFA